MLVIIGHILKMVRQLLRIIVVVTMIIALLLATLLYFYDFGVERGSGANKSLESMSPSEITDVSGIKIRGNKLRDIGDRARLRDQTVILYGSIIGIGILFLYILREPKGHH